MLLANVIARFGSRGAHGARSSSSAEAGDKTDARHTVSRLYWCFASRRHRRVLFLWNALYKYPLHLRLAKIVWALALNSECLWISDCAIQTTPQVPSLSALRRLRPLVNSAYGHAYRTDSGGEVR
jgi:hypothetical protein